MTNKIILLFVGILFFHSVFAKEYFVNHSATGKQSGAKTEPFTTIQQAAEIMKAGDVCWILAGVYPEIVKPLGSGTSDKPMVFKALPGQKVVVTGADPLDQGKWEAFGKQLFRIKTTLNFAHENQVFLNGKTLVEARWPNIGDDLLDPGLSQMDAGTTPEKIVDADLLDMDWTGANVWVHAPKHWANWTSEITSFDKGNLNIVNRAPYPGPKQHVAVEGAEYFIYGCLAALDAENEWYYDENEGYLYVFRKDGKLPEAAYYTKNRMMVFDLNNKAYITLEGFEINGSSVATDQHSRHIVLDGLRILYPYYSSEANAKYGRQTDKGVLIMGRNCAVKNCEIAYSSGCGILLDGQYNFVYNCYIHDTDYIGTYAANVKLQGKGNIISHCTLSRTGRAVIDYGSMYKSLIQYCDMNQSGMLTRDAGLTYGNIIHGGNSELCYNWMHDNLDDHWDMGIYYDHGTQNILTHHNVVWGVDNFGLMINHYGYFHQMYNNTFTSDVSGFRSTWGNYYDPDLYGGRFANNIFSKPCVTTADNHVWVNNIQGYDEMEDHKYLPDTSVCIDAGINIPGITDNFTGNAPDLGAYETGKPRWKTGHDFDNPPAIDTTRTLTIYRNRVENSAFEHEDHLTPWTAKGEVEKTRGGKGQTSPDTEKTRMGQWSIELGGKSEITQKLVDLEADSWYEFSAFLRVEKDEYVVLGLKTDSGAEQQSPAIEGNAPKWHRAVFRFKTKKNQTEAEVYIRRRSDGEGEAYVDDSGLILLELD